MLPHVEQVTPLTQTPIGTSHQGHRYKGAQVFQHNQLRS